MPGCIDSSQTPSFPLKLCISQMFIFMSDTHTWLLVHVVVSNPLDSLDASKNVAWVPHIIPGYEGCGPRLVVYDRKLHMAIYF